MKHKILPIFILSATLFTGCKDNGDFENRVFVDADIFRNEVRVKLDENEKEISREMTVSLARPLENDLRVSLVKDGSLLATYREIYNDPEAELLPDKYCDVSGLGTEIKAGFVSDKMTLAFVNLDDAALKLDEGRRYVLPVTISPDGLDVLPREKTMYYVVRKAALVNAAPDFRKNCAWPDWGTFEEVGHLNEFTMEALVLLNGLESDDNNSIKTIMGIEDNFLIRIGDAGVDRSQIQIAMGFHDSDKMLHRGNITAPSLRLKTGEWYHIAVTFDGEEGGDQPAAIKVYFNGNLKHEGEALSYEYEETEEEGGTPVKKRYVMTHADFQSPHSDEKDGKERCFWLGYSCNPGERWFNGLMSEVRVWNRALTQDELRAPGHFYKLYPDSETGEFPEELLAYWKLDEESEEGGTVTVRDHSRYGNDLTADHGFSWYPVELPQ